METRDFEMMLDSMRTTGIYVIREEDHQILYFNKRVKEVEPDIRLGMVCHELWPSGCPNCPLLHMGDKKESKAIHYGSPFGNAVEVLATRIMWKDTVPAVMLTISPYAEMAGYTYKKILKVNLTEDSFEIKKTDREEIMKSDQPETGLESWFLHFLEMGNVHGKDVERFRNFARLEHLREELRNGKKMLVCTYRRKSDRGYRWHTMEVIPDYNYSNENQSAMLYVKDVHDIYRQGLELEEINVWDREVITSLGELNYGIYVVDLHTGNLHPVRMPNDMKKLENAEYLDWDTVLKEGVEENFHPDDKEKLLKEYSLKALKEARESGESRKEILCSRKLNGSYHYILSTAHFHRSSDERDIAVLAFRDVDEQTKRELADSRSIMRMAAIIKSGYSAMSTIELDTGMCERFCLNEADGKVWKGNYGDFVKKAIEEIVYEEDIRTFKEVMSLESLQKKAKEVENFYEDTFQYRIKTSPVNWEEAHVFYIRQDKNIVVNILRRDITKEKLKEEMAEKEKKDKNYIINTMSGLFFATYYINLNADTFRTITEKREVGEVLGNEANYTEGLRKYAEYFIHPEDRQEYLRKTDRNYLKETLSEEHRIVAVEYRKIKDKNGKDTEKVSWIRANVILAESKNGKAKRALYVAQDVTDSKQKEEHERRMLQEACDAANHANASKSEFLSRMSHDIRTPMNAIIGMTSIAGAHLDDRDRVADCLGKITVSSKHLLSLINEVLDMSKIESGKINLAEEEFSLSQIVENILTIIRPSIEAKEHELEFGIGKLEHEEVIGDGSRLQQVLINIVGNAVKYTPKGGHLHLELTEKKSTLFGYGCYEFVVQDDGIGMTPEYLEKIFDPFSRAEDSRISKIEGTGLGMAIALNIVRKMNGDISVESKVNEGSKFTVTVYLKQQNTVMPDTSRLVDLPVLVVDDDQDACEAVCAVLDDIGMKSKYVLSGKEAVVCVTKSHQEGDDFFAIILDWKMPDMDGLETARQIRKNVGDDVPIIILSAYDWSGIENEAREAGVNGFISKPLFKSRLVYLFRQIVGEEEDTETFTEETSLKQNFAGKRILIVEDNDLNREIAEEIIGSFGVTIETVANGKQAVDRFIERGEGYYDLIFMDVQMPVMNGYEASREIRAFDRADAAAVPIIAMTANAFAEDVVESKKAGMSEHITKPLDIGQLKKCLNEWLGKE